MKKRLQLLFNSLLLLTILICSTKGHSQLSFSQNFTSGATGWTGFNFYEEPGCDGMSILGNFYYYEYPEWEFIDDYDAQVISPLLGTSNGQLATLTYSYKLIDYNTEVALLNSPNWGSFTVSYATSISGPWTVLQTVSPSNHVVSESCVVKTATFTPPAGSQVYLKIYGDHVNIDGTDVFLYVDNISLTQPLVGCTGAPAANTAVAASSAVCNQEQVSLSLSPFNTSSGITYQWQSSTDNVTYTNIAGATSFTYSALQTSTRWYRAITTCTASSLSVTSTPVQVTNTNLPCLCNVGFASGVEPITNVTFSTINNTTSALTSSPARENFTTPQPILIKGLSYPISLQGNTDGATFTNYFKVYIDFNQNGNLDEEGESFEIGTIMGSTGSDGQMATGTINIPPGAVTGLTNMRVIKKFSSYPESACNTSGYGQAEDYIVNIQPCTTVAPTAAAAQTFCAGAKVSNIAVTGTDVKWYAVATGGNALPSAANLVNTTYYASQTTGGCEGPRTAVVVTVNTPLADDPIDLVACGSYTLPALTNGTYRTAANGGGAIVVAGTQIIATTTLYVHGETTTTPVCSIDNEFTITVTNGITADEPVDVEACGSYVLPALSANNVYRTAANGAGTIVDVGATISQTTTLYVYASTTTTPACTDENTFTVTIFNVVADDPQDVVSCSSYVLPVLTNGAYHTAANGGGDVIAAGTAVNATTTLYVYASGGSVTTLCTVDNMFTITINSLEVDELEDVTVCGEYILPEIENGTYYSGASGLGETYEAGDAITETSTLHIFLQEGNCTAESTFTVNVLNVTPVEMNDVTACSEYILPDLPGGSGYFSAPGGQGEAYPPGQPIDASTTVYIQTVGNGTPACTAESSFEITIVNVEALEDQTFTISLDEGETTTLADYELEGVEGTVVWFPNEQAAIDKTPVLNNSTEVPLGTTVYYVRQLIGECYSEPSTVTFTVTLGTDKFNEASFSYHPNPVSDVLTVTYSQDITQITVYNLLGQPVINKQVNATSAQVDLSQVASGTYLVKVQAENSSKVVKIVKNR